MTPVVLVDVTLYARRVDILCADGVIAAIEPAHTLDIPEGAGVFEGDGMPVIPGLHDHHIHLLATAAAATSVRVGPPEVTSADQMAQALRSAADEVGPDGWLRAVGYHDSVAGDLDREVLDAMLSDHPVRVQHRSGALWVLNSAGVDALSPTPDIEGTWDDEARRTGRLWRADAWLREHLAPTTAPDLNDLGRRLAALGVTAVTDMTPITTHAELEALATAVAAMPQQVALTGGVELAAAEFPHNVERGPVKVLIADHALPPLDDLVGTVAAAHEAGRTVAVHCVTRTATVLALAALDEVGVHDGDRIEHGSLISPELADRIAKMGLRVVTQPNFIAERGDDYLRELEPADIADLYRCTSLMERAIPVAFGTDSPFGDPDPWAAISAAMFRRTRSGEPLGIRERLTAHEALALFLSPLDDPGGPPREVAVGVPADLVVTTRAIDDDRIGPPDADSVRLTMIAGRIAYRAG